MASYQAQSTDSGWLDVIHQQWVATLDAIRDAIFVLDDSNRLVRANRAFADLACADSASLIGMGIGDALPWLVDQSGCVVDAIVQDPKRSMYRVRATSVSSALKGCVYILEDVTETYALEDIERSSREGSSFAGIRTIESLLKALGAQDPYTVMHCNNVAKLAKSIAVRLGLSESEAEGIYYGAKVHDIGKLGVPSSILNKPGRLAQAELNLIRLHCETGMAVVQDLAFPWPVHTIIFQHHERLDGSGYPAGLKGDEIDIAARVVAVADVAEAMSSHRPYRPALGIAAALDELAAGKGSRYDPAIVEACAGVLSSGPESG